MLDVCPTCNGSGRIRLRAGPAAPPERTQRALEEAEAMISEGVPYDETLRRLCKHGASRQEAIIWTARARKRMRGLGRDAREQRHQSGEH